MLSDRQARLNPGLSVNVTAAKWNWRFDYPAQGISQIGGDSTPTSLVVPSGTDVHFNLTSLDVIHSFWIPYVRFKPTPSRGAARRSMLSFPGTGYHTAGRCAEFCGLKHDQMTFNVEVANAGAATTRSPSSSLLPGTTHRFSVSTRGAPAWASRSGSGRAEGAGA